MVASYARRMPLTRRSSLRTRIWARRQSAPRRRRFLRSVGLTSLTLSCSAKGARAEAARRGDCPVRASISGARGCQAACRRPYYYCTRGFSPGPKPGAASFSVKLGRAFWKDFQYKRTKLTMNAIDFYCQKVLTEDKRRLRKCTEQILKSGTDHCLRVIVDRQ